MEDFAAILQRDYGLKPQGKSAPMSRASAPPKPKSTPSSRPSRSSPQEDLLFGGNGFMAPGRSTAPPPGSGSAADLLGGAGAPVAYDDVFGGPPKFASPAFTSQASPMQNYDDIFRMPAKASSTSSLPVFDVPVYDDDIFGGVPGVRSASVAYDDVFSGGSGAGPSPAAFEDLLGGFGTAEPKAKSTHWTNSQKSAAMNSGGSLGGDSTHDELLPGFGVAEPAKPRSAGESKASHKASQRTSSGLVNHSPRKVANDPFVVLERDPVVSSAPSAPPFSDLDPFNVPLPSPEAGGKKVSINGVSEIVTGFDGNSPSAPPAPGSFTKSTNTIKENFRRNETDSPARSTGGRESSEAKSVRKNYPSHNSVKDQTKSPRKSAKVEHDRSFNSYEPAASRSHSPSVRNQHLPREDTVPPTNQRAEEPVQFPMADRSRNIDEFWITVDDIKLVTQPSSAPPPSRPPPPPGSKQGSVSRKPVDVKPEVTHDTCVNLNGFSAHQQAAATSWQPPHSGADSTTKVTSKHASNVFDELEEFASGVARVRKEATLQEEEQAEGSAAAAAASATAMKEAMERAEAKLRLANEARERERQEKERDVKASKAREERERAREAREREAREARDREIREARERESLELREREAREAREREAREAEIQEREARETREREEKEKAAREAHEKEEREEREFRERRRKEREREKDKEREREREKDRIAVERATQEARERAAAEARERAERAAVERATAEARARAERAAVERANSEARERAAERVAMGRAATEARDRAEKAAAAREQQRRNENDLESFFMSGSRASSAPRQRPAATDTSSDARPANKGFSSEVQRSSTGAAGLRKVASTVNMADDWTSLFSAGPTTDDFQEMEGESADRRRARWERHQRTLERAAKALDEKNQRDLQGQREQAERHRAAEMLDAEIKRWAAGKEGNLRALLSTLQYVLWPECGWQPVSLTDLITGAAVKKVYRKATLCVHPDKVQQKGATIQQKYIAEKVFDYLKEAWNKFNSEELF